MILIMQLRLAQPNKKISIAIDNRDFIISKTDLILYPQAPTIAISSFYKLIRIVEIGDFHIRTIP